jgi:hypothetical protein
MHFLLTHTKNLFQPFKIYFSKLSDLSLSPLPLLATRHCSVFHSDSPAIRPKTSTVVRNNFDPTMASIKNEFKRLPDTIRPIHYKLELKPDLIGLTFTGKTATKVKVRSNSKTSSKINNKILRDFFIIIVFST